MSLSNLTKREQGTVIVPVRTQVYLTPGKGGTFSRNEIDTKPRFYNTQVFGKKAVQQPVQPVQQQLTPDQVVQEQQAHEKVAQEAVTPIPVKGVPSIFNRTGKKT
jgi:hypothetical protein